MRHNFRKGARVEWNSHGGKTQSRGMASGTVERKITRTTQVKGHTAKASPSEPQYLVRSDNGGIAAHKPGAIHPMK